MKRKILSVIAITIIAAIVIGLYALAIIMGLREAHINPILLVIAGIGALAVVGALIYNSMERIKEIKEEDEDDISKY